MAIRRQLQRRRIYKSVQNLIPNLTLFDSDFPELQTLRDPTRNYFIKLFWIFLLTICSLICLYQTSVKVKIYRSGPKATDVYLKEEDEFQFVTVKVCTWENEQSVKQWRTFVKRDPDGRECQSGFLTLLQTDGVNVESLWQENVSIINRTEFISKASLFNQRLPKIYTRNELSVTGVCTIIYGEKLSGYNLFGRLKLLANKSKICAISNFFVMFPNPIDFQSTAISTDLQNHASSLFFKRYIFLNTSSDPCVTTIEYQKCYQNCLQEKYKRYDCKLPFMTSNTQPYCKASNSTRDMFKEIYEIASELNMKRDCGCKRICDDLIQVFLQPLPDSDQIEFYGRTVGLLSNVVFTIIERHAYSFSDLLTDLSGNVGLYLNLSIVSLLNLFHLFFKLKKLQGTVKDRVQLKISRYFRKQRKRLLDLVNEGKTNVDRSIFIRILNLAILIGCSVMCVYMVYFHCVHYFDYPIHIAVEITDEDNVVFPNITFCKLGGDALSLEDEYIEKNNLSSSICPIPFLDLFHIKEKKVTVEDFWNSALPDRVDTTKMDLGILANKVKSAIIEKPTPFGSCYHYLIDEVPYCGMYTLFLTMFVDDESTTCDHFFAVFSTPRESLMLDLTSKVLVPNDNVMAAATFALMKLNRVDSPNRKCMQQDTYYKCMKNCFDKKVFDKVNCKLPYMEDVNHRMCSNSEEGKKSQSSYFKILFDSKLMEKCQCNLPCKENKYTPLVYNVKSSLDMLSVVVYYMFSNKFENFNEHFSYGIISLLCDFGNSLGLMVGLSILTVGRFIDKRFSD